MAEAYRGKEMVHFFRVHSTGRQPMDEAELCSRLGIDPQLVSMVGGMHKLGELLPGPRWARYENVTESKTLSARAQASSWAFRSWASRADGLIPALHLVQPSVPLSKMRMIYVYAVNGSGKSWLVDKFSAWHDIDTLSSAISMTKPKAATGLELYTARHNFLVLVLRRAVAVNALVITGQWDPAEVVAAAAAIGITMKVDSYRPPNSVILPRLKARGWDDAKIERRVRRWVAFKDSALTWAEIVCRVSVYNAMAVDTAQLLQAVTQMEHDLEITHKLHRNERDLAKNIKTKKQAIKRAGELLQRQ